MSEQKRKIGFTIACVNEFARKYQISSKEAFQQEEPESIISNNNHKGEENHARVGVNDRTKTDRSADLR